MDNMDMNKIMTSIDYAIGQFGNVEKQMEGWMAFAQSLMGVFCFVYFVKKWSGSQIDGSGINLKDYGFPVFLILMMSIYSPLAHGIEKILWGQGFTQTSANGVANAVSKDGQKMMATINNNQKALDSLDKDNLKITGGDIKQDAEDIRALAEQLDRNLTTDNTAETTAAIKVIDDGHNETSLWHPIDSLSHAINGFFEWLLGAVATLLIIVMFLIAKCYTTIYYILGPFALGMSIIPGFEKSWQQWLQRYIGYCLYVPVYNIFVSLANGMMMSMSVSGNAATDNAVEVQMGAAGLLMGLLVLILGLFMAPRIASNIIGMSGGGSSVTKGVGAAATTAVKMTAGGKLMA
jgi:hypothetical protein